MRSRRDFYVRKTRMSKEEKSWFSRMIGSLFSLVTLFMCCIAVVLSGQIYAAGGFDPVVEKWNKVSDALNLTELKEWIFLEKWLSGQILQVSANSYQLIENQMYEVADHEVVAIDDGVVIYCAQQNDSMMVMVRQDNGLIVTYGQLNEVFCSEDDRVVAGAVLAKVHNQVYLDFSWQGESISYEEAIAFEN